MHKGGAGGARAGSGRGAGGAGLARHALARQVLHSDEIFGLVIRVGRFISRAERRLCGRRAVTCHGGAAHGHVCERRRSASRICAVGPGSLWRGVRHRDGGQRGGGGAWPTGRTGEARRFDHRRSLGECKHPEAIRLVRTVQSKGREERGWRRREPASADSSTVATRVARRHDSQCGGAAGGTEGRGLKWARLHETKLGAMSSS